MYRTLFVALVCLALVGCFSMPGCGSSRVVDIPTFPPPKTSAKPPEGAGPSEAASFYRKQAARFLAEASALEAQATLERRQAREAWLWWSGVASIVLAAAAFALSVVYPLAAFLRVGAVAAGSAGFALLVIGVASPYLVWFAFLGAVAICAAVVVKLFADKAVIQSWKATAAAVPAEAQEALTKASLSKQGRFVKAHVDNLLKKF